MFVCANVAAVVCVCVSVHGCVCVCIASVYIVSQLHIGVINVATKQA